MEAFNKNIVCNFYKALATRDTDTVHHLLGPDIDWWFHGPPAHKYNLMWLLTGKCVFDDIDYYDPLVVVAIGSKVVAEGYHIYDNRKSYWVHVWTVEDGKIITKVREYFDTSVTISTIRKSSRISLVSPRSPKYENLWESQLVESVNVPRLLLVL